ncbi:hypothetical protein [Pseudomonas sp.]|uniref:hypothetical protein n=1 Tax=Pseudomonas sp. TaxID=306 RepID=UPI002C6DFB2E|nr:hypothetical protein [Pseudomonas sp.]HUE90524.1 hypothetical protein [Pseudomonas sp.]
MSSVEACLPLLPFTRESATLKVRRAETAVIRKSGLGLYPGHEMAQRPEFITSRAEAQALLLNGTQGVV